MSLIERIKQAEGPSRELDAEIHATVLPEGHRAHPYLDGAFIDNKPWAGGNVYSCPHYTSSIDAALMLADTDEEAFAAVADALIALENAGYPRGEWKARLPRYIAAAALKAEEANDGK